MFAKRDQLRQCFRELSEGFFRRKIDLQRFLSLFVSFRRRCQKLPTCVGHLLALFHEASHLGLLVSFQAGVEMTLRKCAEQNFQTRLQLCFVKIKPGPADS